MTAFDRWLARLSGVPNNATAVQAPPVMAAAPAVSSVPVATRVRPPVVVPRRARSAPSGAFIADLDTALLDLSPLDAFTVRDACAGVHVFGANGSGKTSGSGRSLAKAYLRAGFGGLVLCAKPDEAALWRRYGTETGRARQMIFISPAEPWRFNFIEYELRRAGYPARRVENLLKVLTSLLEQAGRNAGQGEAQFWHNAAELLLRNTLLALAAARSLFTLADVQAFIDTAPRSDTEAQSPEFASSPCGRDLETARAAYEAAGRAADFAVVDNYWRVQFARLPDRTRGSVVMTLNTMLQDLQTGTIRELFGTSTNVFPEDTHEGAVIVLDLPAFESTANLMAQTLFKTVWQQAAIRRGEKMGRNARPIFLWADEAQFFVTARDTDFFSIARSARVAAVYMTQNLAAYQQRLGTGNAEHTAQALMGYFQTKIFHGLSDPPTIQYAQALFGKTVRLRDGINGGASGSDSESFGQDAGRSFSMTGPGIDGNFTNGWSRSVSHNTSKQSGWSSGWSTQEQVEDALFAQDFTQLRGGGRHYRYAVDAFVFATGRIWAATHTTCLAAVFKQKA